MPLLTLLLAAVLGTAADGPWRWPLTPPPEVVRPFAPPAVPYGPGHRGVDLAAYPGQPVYAAGSGRITFAGRIAGRGVIAITHGDLRTTYLPVHSTLSPGRPVTAGTRIGTVEPGLSHCPHWCLHWGLRNTTTYLDPLTLVRPEIRLLPYWPRRTSEARPTTAAPTPALQPAPEPGPQPAAEPVIQPLAGRGRGEIRSAAASTRETRPHMTADGADIQTESGSIGEVPAAAGSTPVIGLRMAGGMAWIQPEAKGGHGSGVRLAAGRDDLEQRSERPQVTLNSATAAAGGAVTGVMVTITAGFLRRRPPRRRRLPPSVIDLTRERRRRRPPA